MSGTSLEMARADDAYIIDAYNEEVDPWDHPAKAAMRGPIRLTCGIRNADYLRRVAEALQAAETFPADLIVYAAGTDVLEGDPLGLLRVTAEGIVKRDELVFDYTRTKRKIPIVMLTSGGYQKNNAEIIATSISNLASKSLISLSPRSR
ncbi:Predicted histone deacetylase [Klebsormidium nitens]|uniref:Predicted histone deacetylase n=1 Tax=Klebsormidium nitens TaxID=105231 RepID=A0A1Y1IJ64_KLENI|nr:Predicted histone deacetylase [Klebsormidium nitens]|eukprot:GAQ89479.1 Predicted histone deacetylase [Klebsormidium nitens]